MNKAKEPTLVQRKVAILGYRAVGKSSLTSSFVSGAFSEAYDPTIESIHHKTIRFRKVHFATDIVDTAGMVRCVCIEWNGMVPFESNNVYSIGLHILSHVLFFWDRMNILAFLGMLHWVSMATHSFLQLHLDSLSSRLFESTIPCLIRSEMHPTSLESWWAI